MNLKIYEIEEAVFELKGLFSLMDTMLYKYYQKNLQAVLDEKISLNPLNPMQRYNFYEIKSFLDLQNLNMDKIRKICECNYKIYNVLIKPFIALPTATYNYKKKLLSRYFSLIFKFNSNKFIEQYETALKHTGLKDSRLCFNSYSLSRMWEFNLDAVEIILGASRSGKSILFLQHLRRIYAFRLDTDIRNADRQIVEDKILNTQVMYDIEQTEIFKRKWILTKPSIFCFDDAYTEGLDNRRAMSPANIFLSSILNNKANRLHITFINMQQGKDLDNRYTDKSNGLLSIKKRSMSRLYAKRKDMPFIKTTYGFNTFEKKPYLISNNTNSNYNLNRMSAFIAKTRWRDMSEIPTNNNYNKPYEIYLTNKNKYQMEEIEEIKPKPQPLNLDDPVEVYQYAKEHGIPYG